MLTQTLLGALTLISAVVSGNEPQESDTLAECCTYCTVFDDIKRDQKALENEQDELQEQISRLNDQFIRECSLPDGSSRQTPHCDAIRAQIKSLTIRAIQNLQEQLELVEEWLEFEEWFREQCGSVDTYCGPGGLCEEFFVD